MKFLSFTDISPTIISVYTLGTIVTEQLDTRVMW